MPKNGPPPILPPGAQQMQVSGPIPVTLVWPSGKPIEISGPMNDATAVAMIAAQLIDHSAVMTTGAIEQAAGTAMALFAEVAAQLNAGRFTVAFAEATARHTPPSNTDETKTGRSVDQPAGPRLEP